MELALAHCKLGWSALGRGDHEIARTHFIESLPYAQKVRYRGGIVDVLTGLASVAEAHGAWVQAARLPGAAEVLFDAIGATQNTRRRL